MNYELFSRTRSKKIKVKLDMSNYATKFGLKKTTAVDALYFAKRLIKLV